MIIGLPAMEAPVEIDGVLPGNDLLLSSLSFLHFPSISALFRMELETAQKEKIPVSVRNPNIKLPFCYLLFGPKYKPDGLQDTLKFTVTLKATEGPKLDVFGGDTGI